MPVADNFNLDVEMFIHDADQAFSIIEREDFEIYVKSLGIFDSYFVRGNEISFQFGNFIKFNWDLNHLYIESRTLRGSRLRYTCLNANQILQPEFFVDFVFRSLCSYFHQQKYALLPPAFGEEAVAFYYEWVDVYESDYAASVVARKFTAKTYINIKKLPEELFDKTVVIPDYFHLSEDIVDSFGVFGMFD